MTAERPSTAQPSVRLKPREEKRILQGHPWAYGNELQIDNSARAIKPGTLVRLLAADGRALGLATFNLHSLIAARIIDRNADAVVDQAYLRQKLRAADALRRKLLPDAQGCYRLVHSEADGLPGFVVDRYGSVFAVQANSAGAELLTGPMLDALDAEFGATAIVLRNESSVRKLEGLALETRLARGASAGVIDVAEGQCRFPVDPAAGQKTGWYFDLRPARAHMAQLAKDATSVLDLFCHTGAFGVQMAKAGQAQVLGIDGSEPALDLANRAAHQNDVGPRCSFERQDAFAALDRLAAEGRQFDIVVADPPSFVKSRKELAAGAKGYRKLARLASARVAPGGFFFMACCSHHMPADGFMTEVVAGLGLAGRNGRLILSGGAGPDHPIHPHLPESAYIKYLIFQLD